MSAVAIQTHLQLLEAERMYASLRDLASDLDYMADLMDEIETARRAYVIEAVTEIASLRAELSGPQLG